MPENSKYIEHNLNLEEILQAFENQYEEVPDEVDDTINNDSKIIDSDVNRTFPFYEKMTEEERSLFQKDLKKVLLEIPLPYIQSMCDVVAVLMYFYYTRNKDTESLASLAQRENTTSAVEFEYTLKKKQSLFDQETYDIMLRTIYNILKQKYIPLIENKFQMYMKMNEVFLKIMKKREIDVPISKSLVYINTTLTWFSRSLEKIDDVYKVFALIISCPLNCVFLLLINYYEEVDKKQKIELENEEMIEKLFHLEQEFLSVQNEKNEELAKKGKKALALAITAGAVLSGAIIFGLFKKK